MFNSYSRGKKLNKKWAQHCSDTNEYQSESKEWLKITIPCIILRPIILLLPMSQHVNHNPKTLRFGLHQKTGGRFNVPLLSRYLFPYSFRSTKIKVVHHSHEYTSLKVEKSRSRLTNSKLRRQLQLLSVVSSFTFIDNYKSYKLRGHTIPQMLI